AVLAGPVVAGEHSAAGDLAPVRVARHAHVADQADHHRPADRRVSRVQLPFGVLDHLGLLLEEQHDGAPNGAYVDRFVRCVQYEHPPNSPPAPLVLRMRRGPSWGWYRTSHGLAAEV